MERAIEDPPLGRENITSIHPENKGAINVVDPLRVDGSDPEIEVALKYLANIRMPDGLRTVLPRRITRPDQEANHAAKRAARAGKRCPPSNPGLLRGVAMSATVTRPLVLYAAPSITSPPTGCFGSDQIALPYVT